MIITTADAPAAIGPYVQGVNLGAMTITSGQLPINPLDGTMPGDIAEQARQSLENVKAIVEAAGLTVGQIVKTTVFVKDLADFAAINAAYEAFFIEHQAAFPARSCVWRWQGYRKMPASKSKRSLSPANPQAGGSASSPLPPIFVVPHCSLYRQYSRRTTRGTQHVNYSTGMSRGRAPA